MSGGAALQPTFQGHVATTQDALILFEACLQGHLSHVPRRPHDRERSSLIRSGCIFIYEENASGIKRWTDGVTWSPSRILGNFLVYRELDKPFPPGEKKRAMKKQQRRPSRPGEPYARPEGNGSFSDGQSSPFNGDRVATEMERQLIGSLVDSYGFKQDGLVKKTMSVTVQGVTHHLVSYYNVHDVMQNTLRTPSQTDNLHYIRPRAELTQKQSFRAPLEDAEEVDGNTIPYGANGGYRVSQQGLQYYMPQQGYPPMTQQPSQPSYQMGGPPMGGSYLQSSATAPPLQNQRPEYSTYDQSAYSRGYEPLNNSMPPAQKPIPTTPATMASTSQTQPPMNHNQTPMGHSQTSMYPPMQRPINTISPASVDPRSGMPYRTTPYPVSTNLSPIEPSRHSQPSPTQIKYEDRRESGHPPPQIYQSSQSPYYADGARQSIGQQQYSQHPPLSQWGGQHHSQH